MLVVILLRLKAGSGPCTNGYTHAGLRLQRAQLTHVLASVSFTRMTRRMFDESPCVCDGARHATRGRGLPY